MKRKIVCLCDNVIEAEYPEEYDLDKEPAYMDEIQNGSFLNFFCQNCKKTHKPEFPIFIHWPSRNLKFEIIPELERGDFYRRTSEPSDSMEAIIGYPEMTERLSIISDSFDPVPIEAIKYRLGIKAEEQYPDSEIDIRYFRSDENNLEFHIHGMKEDQVAIMKIPRTLYDKTFTDYKENPSKEMFTVLRVKNYLSYKNTMRA
ncbi:MAG: hypothetical protein FWG77_00900 [Treponema sp.]|nr:hypothetical protein [Treponema sp.]